MTLYGVQPGETYTVKISTVHMTLCGSEICNHESTVLVDVKGQFHNLATSLLIVIGYITVIITIDMPGSNKSNQNCLVVDGQFKV